MTMIRGMRLLTRASLWSSLPGSKSPHTSSCVRSKRVNVGRGESRRAGEHSRAQVSACKCLLLFCITISVAKGRSLASGCCPSMTTIALSICAQAAKLGTLQEATGLFSVHRVSVSGPFKALKPSLGQMTRFSQQGELC